MVARYLLVYTYREINNGMKTHPFFPSFIFVLKASRFTEEVILILPSKWNKK